jgi:hypothetical protein
MAFNKQSPVLLYLIMLLGFVLGFLYNSQLDPSAAVEPISPRFLLTSLRGLEGLKIDYAMLTSPQFQSLRVFGQLPVPVQPGGKDDPFR